MPGVVQTGIRTFFP